MAHQVEDIITLTQLLDQSIQGCLSIGYPDRCKDILILTQLIEHGVQGRLLGGSCDGNANTSQPGERPLDFGLDIDWREPLAILAEICGISDHNQRSQIGFWPQEYLLPIDAT